MEDLLIWAGWAVPTLRITKLTVPSLRGAHVIYGRRGNLAESCDMKKYYLINTKWLSFRPQGEIPQRHNTAREISPCGRDDTILLVLLDYSLIYMRQYAKIPDR